MLVETIVREDAIALYGFLETAERDWFRIPTTVQGVGAGGAVDPLDALARRNRPRHRRPRSRHAQPTGRVGPKLAARLATELKDKAAAFGVAPAAKGAAAPAAMPSGSINEDAVSALVNLGYKRVEAFGAVARVTQRLGEGATFDAVVRAGLQELAR